MAETMQKWTAEDRDAAAWLVGKLTPATARALLLLTQAPQLERHLIEQGTSTKSLFNITYAGGWRVAGYDCVPGCSWLPMSAPECDMYQWSLTLFGLLVKAMTKKAGWYLEDA